MASLDDLSASLWPSFVEYARSVIVAGLNQLAADAAVEGFDSSRENNLNRELFFRVSRIVAQQNMDLFAMNPRPTLRPEHTWHHAPAYEMSNQPSPDDAEQTPREDKRPDFQWRFMDNQAEDPRYAMRTYVVECKRLGQAIGTWVLNENYVAHGIRRFVDGSHLYGKDDRDGGMIGYVQSMDVDGVWAEVTAYLAGLGLTALPKPGPHPSSAVLHASQHELTRANAWSPFRLHHFWVDLRGPAS